MTSNRIWYSAVAISSVFALSLPQVLQHCRVFAHHCAGCAPQSCFDSVRLSSSRLATRDRWWRGLWKKWGSRKHRMSSQRSGGRRLSPPVSCATFAGVCYNPARLNNNAKMSWGRWLDQWAGLAVDEPLVQAADCFQKNKVNGLIIRHQLIQYSRISQIYFHSSVWSSVATAGVFH